MELSEQTKFITNKNEVMQNVIGTYLPHSEKLDFLVGMEVAVDLNNCICEIVGLGKSIIASCIAGFYGLLCYAY